MTFNELRFAIEELLPGAQLDEDMDGQIVVYTNLMIDENFNSQVTDFVSPDDEDDNG